MKMISFFLTLLLAFGFSLSAQAISKEDSLKKLKVFSDVDVKADKTARRAKDHAKKNQRMEAMLAAIEEGVDLLSKVTDPTDSEMTKEICRVALLTFELDPSEYAAELMLPLYKKDKAAFEKGARLLPKAQAEEILESMKIKLREETEGNG